jgi:hypothetical protein
MSVTKFVVKVNRRGTRAPEHLQRADSTLIQMTTNRKLALRMCRFTAEDDVRFPAKGPVQPRVGVRSRWCLAFVPRMVGKLDGKGGSVFSQNSLSCAN